MTWLDYAVLGIVAACILWGVWRGLVREVVSILGWIIAFLAANLFAAPFGQSLPEQIPTPELRLAAAFVLIFIGALAATTLLGLVLSKIVKAIGLESLDRVLGALFGLAKAALILAALALLFGLTSAPRQSVWRDSVSGAPLARIALVLKPLLPPAFAERLRYD